MRELKSNQDTANIPIIIISVYENKSIASQRGISDYLVKPFEPGQLLSIVHKAMNGKHNSAMMVDSSNGIADVMLEMLRSNNINVRHIEHSGNLLIITLDGEEG